MIKSLNEVIERLQYKADNIKAKLEPSYFTECIDYLKTLPREKSGWIPCSERLPKKNGIYLVTQKRYSVETQRVIGIETDYVQFTYGKWSRARFLEVIAWQPLPEPYKGGIDND